jgi:hypothetical protein
MNQLLALTVGAWTKPVVKAMEIAQVNNEKR